MRGIFSLTTKQRRHNTERPTTAAFWVKDYATIFLKRFMETGSEIDLYAFMGIISGILTSVEGAGYEKDFRNYKKLKGFKQLKNFIRSLDNK